MTNRPRHSPTPTGHRRGRAQAVLALAALLAWSPVAEAVGGPLAGSPSSMVRQHAVAMEEHYAFLRRPSDVSALVEQGLLVQIQTGDALTLAGTSFPYARPEVARFLTRFARDFRDSTGGVLTVTSLTRPATLQPRNAHRLSVHPAGIAVDFRVPRAATEQAYLERALLRLERGGRIDATRERHPAHYHVAVFRDPILAWVAARDSVDPIIVAAHTTAVVQAGAPSARIVPGRSSDEPTRSGQTLHSRLTSVLGGLAVLSFVTFAVATLPASRRRISRGGATSVTAQQDVARSAAPTDHRP